MFPKHHGSRLSPYWFCHCLITEVGPENEAKPVTDACAYELLNQAETTELFNGGHFHPKGCVIIALLSFGHLLWIKVLHAEIDILSTLSYISFPFHLIKYMLINASE